MKLTFFLLAMACISVAGAEVVGKVVEYSYGDIKLRGYIVYDNSIKEKRPGIIVVHEWWGVTDYPKKRAEMLAELGYVAFAADMYGYGKIADNPADAKKNAGESMKDLPALKGRFLAALEILKNDELVDPERIASIGYCYGGGVALNMARAGVDLKGIVSFHGSLASSVSVKRGQVNAKILICNGGADKNISEKDIDNFKKEMKSAGVNFKFISYSGALHAFSNPAATELGKKFNMPIAYNEKADKDSWAEMQKFFKTIF